MYLFTTNDNTGIPFPSSQTNVALNQSQFSQELVLNGSFTDKLHMTSGLYYFQESGYDEELLLDNVNNFGAGPFLDPLRFQANDVRNSSEAAFANISYDILSNVTASFGYRYSFEQKHLVLDNVFLTSGVIFGKGPETFNGTVPLYDGKLTWQVTPDLFTYVKYGTGYRSGGAGFEASTTDAQFQPETAKTAEVGFKWNFTIGSMPARLNTALFNTIYRNFQVQVVEGNPVTSTYVNAGQATINGAEFEFTVKPITNLNISASLGLLDAHYDSFTLDSLILGGLVNLKNNQLREAPKAEFSLDAGYTIPTHIGDWLFQVDYAYQSSYEEDPVYQPDAPGILRTNLFHQGPTNNVNARITLAKAFGSNIDVSLWGKNLTDQKRFDFTLSAGGLNNATYAEPLSVGLEVRASF